MTYTIDVHLSPDEVRQRMRADAIEGLRAPEKSIPPVWFYDERGSQLFEQITLLPEYYPTRAERHLLELHAPTIAALSKADTLVELGAGTCDKSRVLLDAMRAAGTLERYVPLDVSDTTLWSAANALAVDYPGLSVRAVVGDFHRHMDRIPSEGRRMVAFLGSTIGNLTLEQRTRFLFDLDCVMVHGDSLLLGTDLVKDLAVLQAAYDDSAGVTAAFNRNVLYVLNRELKADFDPERFEHVAVWNEEWSCMEMRLRSVENQTVLIAELGMEVFFAAGEDLRTEISSKFTPSGVQAELWNAGFVVDAMWEEPEGFLLTLATPYC